MSLAVFLNQTIIGELDTRNGQPHFVYAQQWRSSPNATPLSLSLPLAADAHSPETVASVLWGLLPDNPDTLRAWARKFGVSARNPVALLTHMGEDCAGAVAFVVPDRLEQWLNSSYKVQPIDSTDMERRLRELRVSRGVARDPDDQGQFSLAGAQPKMAVHYRDQEWGIPSGTTPTTHILKPPTGELDGIPENEHFCFRLAQAIGLPTAPSVVLEFGKEVTLCVERYDRTVVDGRYIRLHQEDFCQALGIDPQRKHQDDGGPSPKAMADVLYAHSERPAEDVSTLFRALVFNWIIAGTDAHAKNYSMFLGPQGRVRLAPLYDLLSVLPYPQFNAHKTKLSMKIGSKYRYGDIRLRDWLKTAADLRVNLRTAMHVLTEMTEQLPKHAQNCVKGMTNDGLRHPIIDQLEQAVVASAARCASKLDASEHNEAENP